MGVFFRTEDTKDLVLLMNGFPKVPSLLLVPPASMGISELTLFTGRVLVAAILELREAPQSSINLNQYINAFGISLSYLQRIVELSSLKTPDLRE